MVPVVKHIVQDLKGFGIGAVSITGETKDRLTVLTQFKEDPNTLVMVATSWCLGVGVTLTEASLMLFFGTPWRSTDYEQASDRIWRIGQTEEVDIYTVLMKSRSKNLSSRMQDILDWSGRMFDTAITAAEVGEAAQENYHMSFGDAEPAVEYYGWRELPGLIGTMQKIMADFTYGLKRGNRIVNPETDEEFDAQYRSLSPGLFLKLKGGCCYDAMAYQDFFYKAHGVTCSNYLIEWLTEPYETHTFTVVEYKNQFIYYEWAFEAIRGAWIANSLDDIVSFIVNIGRYGQRQDRKDLKLWLLKSNYGKYNETMDEILKRFHETGTVMPFRYDPTVVNLAPYDTYYMERANEHFFNLNQDGYQYDELNDGQTELLKRIQERAGPIMGARATWNDDEDKFKVAWYLHRMIDGVFSFMLYIDGIDAKPFMHPMTLIPFEDGALLLEYGFDEKRNGLYFADNVHDVASALTNWVLIKMNYDLTKTDFSMIQVRLYSLNHKEAELIKDRHEEMRESPMGEKMTVQYNAYCRELHKVEVLNHGWLIQRN
jgi:hypothetical protein